MNNKAKILTKRPGVIGRGLVGQGYKVKCSAIFFQVPGTHEELNVPVFTAMQSFEAIALLDLLGNDYDLARSFTSHIFERVVGWDSDHSEEIPTNDTYNGWIREWRVNHGMITTTTRTVGAA